jgi:hypothetical protein
MNWRLLVRALPGLVTIGFLGLLAVWAFRAVDEYSLQQETGRAYGTVELPVSDAAVWVRGGYRFLFGFAPESNLYRPAIGLIYASLIAVGGTPSVAVFPILLFGLWFCALFFLSDKKVQPLVLIIFSVFVLFFGAHFAVQSASLGSALTEVLTLTLTVMATTLLAFSTDGKSISWFPASVGFGLLGIAAAIRGLQLVGGLIVFIGLSLWLWKSVPKHRLALLLGVFLTPTLIDGAIRRIYGIRGNGIPLIYVFTQPPHRWVQQTHWDFLRSGAPDREVLSQFASFIFSSEGITTVFRQMAEVLVADLGKVHVALFAAVVLAAFMVGDRLRPPKEKPEPSGEPRPPLHRFLEACEDPEILGAAQIGLILLSPFIAQVASGLLLLWIISLLVVSFRRRMPLTFFSLAIYLGCLLLYVVTCMPGLDRTRSTFGFTLFFALVAFAFEIFGGPRHLKIREKALAPSCYVLVGLVGFLYLGFLVVPNSTKAVFTREVTGRNAAMKLASNERMDRSLYINGKGETFFTRWNGDANGSVVKYGKLLTTPVPPSIANDPGFEPMQLLVEASLRHPFSFSSPEQSQ